MEGSSLSDSTEESVLIQKVNDNTDIHDIIINTKIITKKDNKNINNLWYALIISSVLVFSGISVLAPNLTHIAKEFNFNESERDQYLGKN